jgi:tetratricopeptide (TPR) repeat protein
MRGVAFRNTGNTDAALADFDKALHIMPTSSSTLAERGWTKYMLKKEEAALKDFTTAITYAEPNAWLYVQRGSVYQSLGDSAKAKSDFEMALQLDTVSSAYAFALLRLGKSLPAINFMKTIVAENPDDSGEYYDLACLYSLANMKSESIAALKHAVELGYKCFHHIQLDRDLDNIRNEQGYKELLSNITKTKVSKMLEGYIK